MPKRVDYLKKWIKEHPNESMIMVGRQPVEGNMGPTVELGELNIAADSLIHVDSAGDAQRIADAASAQMLIAQGVNSDPSWNAVSGDVTISSSGVVTIGAAKVTDAMMVNDKVNVAGDTMTGDLTMSGANVLLAGNILNLSAITLQEVSDIATMVIKDDTLDAGLKIQNTDGYVQLSNGTSSVGAFLPALSLKTGGVSTIAGRVIARIPVALDSGSTPALRLEARQDDNTVIATRPILGVYNFNTKLFEIDKDGNVDVQGNVISNVGIDVSKILGLPTTLV